MCDACMQQAKRSQEAQQKDSEPHPVSGAQKSGGLEEKIRPGAWVPTRIMNRAVRRDGSPEQNVGG